MKTRAWVAAGIASLMFGAAIPATLVQAFELSRGVIVDPGRGVVYLMNREHGIDATEIASGKIIWHTTVAAEPLLLLDDRLVAQAETPAGARTLQITILNTAANGEPVVSAAVPLPAPVFASIDDGMSTSFTADARMASGALEVSWHFVQRAASGFGRPGSPLTSEVDGAARIDLKTAQVQVLPARNASTRPSASSGGIATANIRLEQGFNFAIASADGLTILANKAAGIDATGWTDYLWAIYSLQTHERLAEIRMPTSAAPFFVLSSMLVYVSRPYGRRIDGKWIQEPLELRAVDLNNGREAWKMPVRDPAYRGPLPPRP
jgi:hypothetical protein